MIPSGAHWLLVAIVVAGATAFAALAAVRAAARLPVALAASAALALVVCFETVLLNALSVFHAVARGPLVAAHAAAAATVMVLCRSAARREAARLGRAARSRRAAGLVLAPLVALAALSALRYAPNNGDSMEYHLARVAHWIQYRSVGEYPTGSIRQTALAPGAEYLLLALQAISGSDRLDALLQLGCYLIVVLSAPSLARLAGAPRAVAAAAAALAAAVPMGLLQASSTQNDLVASVLAVAVVAASIRFARMRHAVRLRHALLLGVAVAAATLVKVTAVVTMLPLLAVVVVATVVRAGRAPRAARVAALAASAVAAIALSALELWRPLALARVPSAIARFTYPPLGDWEDRLVNPVRGVLRHLAAPEALVAMVGPVPFEYDFASLVDGFGPLVPHEDFVGNPVHAALALCAVLGLAARWRRVKPRARWAVPSLVAAWVLFHAVFRDNAYLGRLQLPLFALAPAFLAVVPRGAWPARVTAAAAAAAVALALWVGVRNHARPPLAAEVGPRTLTYYRTFGAERPRSLQLEVMKVAERTECRRIGIFMGENGFDYPLTWLSMLRGAEVRHILAADPWPCLVYAEPGSWPGWGLERPDVALSPAQWTLAGVFGGTPYLFVRKPAAPASRADE